jgi:hypothetical protein
MSPLAFAAAAALSLAAGAAAAQMGPPAHAREGRPAWNVGIPQPSPPGVFFLNLRDGAEVTSPFRVEFGAIGLKIAEAGVEKEGLSGHHHLLIDVDPASLPPGEPLPATDGVRHFGDGATAATLDLPPGTYRLRLLAADLDHVPHDPPILSAPVTVTVR